MSAPVLDEQALVERLGPLGGVHAAMVVDLWLASLTERVDAIRVAAATRDASGLAMAAHTLRGGAINVGAQRLAEDCAEIERRLRDGATIGAVGDTVIDIERDASASRDALLTTTALSRIA